MDPDTPKAEPRRTALLVMDFQNGILGRYEEADVLLERAARAIATVRELGGTVGFVRVALDDEEAGAVPQHNKMFARIAESGGAMHADSPTTEIHDQIAPQDGDIVVRKKRVGAFSTTDLAEQLAERGIDTVLLAGVSTSGVVLSTVRDAADRDFAVYVLADACADGDAETHRVLTEKVFPRQAHVIETADLGELLGS